MRIRIYTCILIVLSVCQQALAQFPQRTIQDIELLLNEKSSRTSAQQKVDSRLLQYVREKRGQKMVAGITLDAVTLQTTSDGNITVDIEGQIDDNLATQIESIGGQIVFQSTRFHSMRVNVKPALVESLAALSGVRFIKPAAIPKVVGREPGKQTVGAENLPLKSGNKKIALEVRAQKVKKILTDYLGKLNIPNAPYVGIVNSEGDRAHRANDARNTYGFAGQGIRIGVISDSYNSSGTAAAEVAAGELPGTGNPLGNTTPVTVLEDYARGTDEGRAMLQIVHDLAPKAQLFFATAYNSPAAFASNIIALRNAPYNCDVIIDDIGYSDEPVFYDGIIAQAVNVVTGNGGLYFSSAGNSGSAAKNFGGVFEGDFSDAGSLPFTGTTRAGSVHNFGTLSAPVNGDSIIATGSWYTLDWSDAPSASSNDYDLFVISAAGAVKAFSTNVQNGSQDPHEEIYPVPTLVAGDKLLVFKTAGAATRAIRVYTAGGRLKLATVGHTFGHSAAVDAFCVAATPAAAPWGPNTQTGPFPGAFNPTNQVELFSSDGPRRIFYNSNGTPITPGNFLFGTNGGVNRNKPDITAADGVSTSTPGFNPFYGTSASAPHAGAIAALLKSANRSLTPAQIRAALTTTSLDIESPGFDNLTGYGILQAFQAMQMINPTPQATLNLGTITGTEGSFSNGNGTIDLGEIGNLAVQLNNFSLVTATNVTATLSTTTAGVTVLQSTSGYGNIGGSGNMTNLSPFSVAFSSKLSCGSIVNFTLVVSFSGGSSPIIFPFTYTLGSQPFASGISGTLGLPPSAGAGYTVSSGTQTGRLARTGIVSTCAAPGSQGLTTTVGSRQFDAYTFTNSGAAAQCVTVTLASPNGNNIYAAAYNDLGFVPANPATNVLASAGTFGPSVSFAVNVAAGKAFTVVVHDVNVLPASNSPYTISLSLATCAAGPTCTPTNITTAGVAAGAVGTAYSQEFAATGGSGNYSFSVLGNLPAGLSFSGNKITGTPTQAGTFPIRIVAADLTGCPPDTNSYSLVIAGIPPASVATVSGTPQTVQPAQTFADSLKVIVKDADGNALGGVGVVFTAPATGASGTFEGGVRTVTVITKPDGTATAPPFTANAVTGTYTVQASVTGVPNAVFTLTNFCPAAFVVTSNADSGPGSLREIVSNACAGIPITFAPSVTNIVLTTGDIVITKALSITGPGASKLSISGNLNSRVFTVSTLASSSVIISGLTIRDGKVPETSDFGGGGVLVYSGNVTLRNCYILNNDASFAYYSEGGGVDNEGGVVTIDRSTITNNSAYADGGGIAQWGGSMSITNSTISGNIVGTVGYGGGIYSAAALSIVSSTIYGNSAYLGGNICRGSSTVNLRNSIIGGGSLIGTGGAGPDIYGISFISGDYNFIQTLTGGTVTGVTAHNITGQNPNLLPLTNYGGEIPVHLPRPSSSAINAGDPLLASGTDQRGFNKPAANLPDIGSVEANYSIVSVSGADQKAGILLPFALPMQARVTENTIPVAGIPVFFAAPAIGPGSIFPNLLNRDTVSTGITGVATSRVFRANNLPGVHYDTARIGSAFPYITYMQTNQAAEGPLPLVYGAITASSANCTTNINWQTLTEINTKDFSVEFSTDGITFSTVSTVPAKGNSTTAQAYSYSHGSAVDGINYYRIKQTDLNGAFTYSTVLIVTNNCGKQPIVAYPNPVKNTLTVVLPGNAKRTLEIFDAVGRKVYTQTVNGGKQVINASGWVQGVYTVSISQKGEKVYLLKVIKD